MLKSFTTIASTISGKGIKPTRTDSNAARSGGARKRNRRLSLNRHPSTALNPPSFLSSVPFVEQILPWSAEHLNFYRVHMIFFLIVPLIASGIFYASNGDVHIQYIDCLFMVVSATTVTGLNSVLLHDLTTWQQVILFMMMCVGSTSFVSIITIIIRRSFFRRKFEYMVNTSAEARHRVNEVGASEARKKGAEHQFYHPFSGRDGHGIPVYPTIMPEDNAHGSTSNFQNGGSEDAKHHLRKTALFLSTGARNKSGTSTPLSSVLSGTTASNNTSSRERTVDSERKKKKKKPSVRLRADMIKRIDVPVRVNEMSVGGWLDSENNSRVDLNTTPVNSGQVPAQLKGNGRSRLGLDDGSAIADDGDQNEPDVNKHQTKGDYTGVPLTYEPEAAKGSLHEHQTAIQIDEPPKPKRAARRFSDPTHHKQRLDPLHDGHDLRQDSKVASQQHPKSDDSAQGSTAAGQGPKEKYFPRSRTVEFRDHSAASNDGGPESGPRRARTQHPIDPDFPMGRRRMSHASLRDPEMRKTLTRTGSIEPSALTSGFGGFPNPIVAAASYARRRLPGVNAFERHLTMPKATTFASTHSIGGLSIGDARVKPVSYISFDAVVGRNSKFHGLTTAQQEELGGVEYRALTVLLKIVFGYWFFTQMLAVLALAPWLTYSNTYKPVFTDPALAVNPTWFVFFQVWSAFSNNGMSLIDASMVPFSKAYWLIICMSLLILGGNTAFPVFLRLVVWICSKCVPNRSRTKETLQFLLDHPRRCFIYLFPSHQTWFLVFVLVVLNCIDWLSFLILDIGNAEIEQIPVGTRIIDGLLQSFAVRCAGFSIVTLSATAPALQLLYVVMMYIAVYPIAVSIRSTNVYEEKSMGIFDGDDDEDEDEVEARFDKGHSAKGYIAYHARKQLAFDMWWLVLALWLSGFTFCIVERRNISDSETPWITIFTLMFEVSSSYGTVGLSLGTPTKNTSLAGTLRTLSKLILCAVMIRGRHRGLPIAIDRAVLLPADLVKHGDDTGSTFVDDQAEKSATKRAGASTGGLSSVEPQTDEARVRKASEIEGIGLSDELQRPDEQPDKRTTDEKEAHSSEESISGRQGQGRISDRRDIPGWTLGEKAV